MKNIFLLVVLLGLNIPLSAQKFKDLLKQSLNETGSEQKAKLDSSDFQFAISINENAGFFDIQQKGEGLTKALYLTKDQKTKTPLEKIGDSYDSAIMWFDKRRYTFAGYWLKKVQRKIQQANLEGELINLRCISTLGVVSLIQGKYQEADNYIAQALEMSEQKIGKKSPGYVANLNSRAKLNQLIGNFNDSETQFTEAYNLSVAVFGEASPQTAIIQNNKAMLNLAIGRSDQAVSLMKEAISLMDKAPKKGLGKKDKSFDGRKFQSNLALAYQSSGKYQEAESTFVSIENIFKSRGQTSNPEYAALLNQMALLYIQMGKNDRVEELLKKSASIYKSKFTEQNPSYAKTQNDLGIFYRIQGRYAEAEAASLKALEIRLKTLGEEHPDYVKSVENTGLVYWKKGDLAKANNYLKEAVNKSLNFINNYFKPMSEAEKTKYWETLQPRFQRFYAFALEMSATNPEIIGDVFNYQIVTKALLLNSTNKVKKTILASGNASLIRDYTNWLSKKEALSRYYALSKEDLQEQKIDLQALENEANGLERQLSTQSNEFSDGYTTAQIDYKQLAALLNDNEALVEVVRIRGFDKDFTDQSRYAALVLVKGAVTPKFAIMENGGQLETRYAKFYKNTVIQRQSDPYSYDQYWAKIDPLLTGKKLIYFSPDGVYNQINVNTLKKEGGEYVALRFDIVTIGNPKDLVKLKAAKRPLAKKDAFLLGFPDYGGMAVALPGTKVELDGISKVLKAGGFVVNMKQQKEATEKNMKAVKSPLIMHIATHGYFLADSEIGKGNTLGVDAENAKGNPLLRSGLILTNTTGQKHDTTRVDFGSNDNGILTAYEAMNLDLEGTELIILSACETGLGDVRAGEGVYGLQRAFLVAGANALIMSLWKVDDAATQELMNAFYSNWTKLNNKLQAFKLAQKQLMTKYKDPYFWGAFVMMGM